MPFHGITRGLKHGFIRGIKRGAYFGGGITVPTDGPGSVYVPQSNAHYAQLGIGNPVSIWLCQEASGNLADVNTTNTLTVNLTPAYQQTISGWTRFGITFTDATNQRFNNGTTTPNAASTSVAMLMYWKPPAAAPAATRGVIQVGTNVSGRINNTPRFQQVTVGATITGSANPAGQPVEPVLLVYDRTNTLVRLFTQQEQINGTWNAGATGPNVSIGETGQTSSAASVLYAALWSGAAAEALGKATLQTLGWTLAY